MRSSVNYLPRRLMEIASKVELEEGTVIIGADTIVSYKNEILRKAVR